MIKIISILLLACSVIFCNEIDRFKRSQSCGVSRNGIGLIIGGNYSTKGDYPWMAVLMEDKEDEPKYFCGGVLISNKKVLTAAHCIYPKNGVEKLPRDVLVLLGAHNIKKSFEPGRVTVVVKRIIVHNNWNPKSVNYDYDIAALLLENEIQFTDAIQPICLWTSDVDPAETEGVVIGYGKSEDETIVHESTLKQLKIPIISSNERCFLMEPSLITLSSERTFCAGAANGSGPCLGDSGHGLFIKHNNVFYLRGLVSSSLRTAFTCDTSKYAIFTNVLKFKNWIVQPLVQHTQITITIAQNTLKKKFPYDDSICGLMSQNAGLIQGGDMSQRNQFPWMAIIKTLSDNEWSHRGSGSLITHKHVIADAGCVSYLDYSNNLTPIEINAVKIHLGTTKYDDLSAFGSIEIGVFDIKNYLNARKVLSSLEINKISLITLDHEVAFTEFIRPVCLWPFGDDFNDIAGRDAYVVGYGVDQMGRNSLTRKHIHMTITDENEDCQNTFAIELKFKNETKLFCAKGQNQNQVPCYKDIQLFMKIGVHWYLKGLASTMNNYRNGTCNAEKPTLYEDISSFVPWILNEI